MTQRLGHRLGVHIFPVWLESQDNRIIRYIRVENPIVPKRCLMGGVLSGHCPGPAEHCEPLRILLEIEKAVA
jgi:hypothetical protein